MAMDTSKIKLPLSVTTHVRDSLRGTSTIAALSPSTPQLFADSDTLVFNGAAEAEVVGEGEAKSAYEQTVEIVEAKRIKIQTTTRVSSELQWADEDDQLQIIAAIQEDQTKALGRALDYVVYHALQPKTGLALSGYSALTANSVQVAATGDAAEDLDALIDALVKDYTVDGIALSRTFAADLRKVRVPNTMARLYPEVPINLNVGNIEGLNAAVSKTVNGDIAQTPTGVLAILGDFSLIQWGMVRDVWSEIIQFGDPDGAGKDLKRYNQVAYRTEAVLAYKVLDPKGFATLKAAE